MDTTQTVCTVLNGPNSFDTVQIVLELSGQFENRPDKTVWTESKPSGPFLYQSGQCWNCPDSVKTVRTVSTLCVQFHNHPDNFKLYGQFENFPDRIKTIRTVLTLSGLFEKGLVGFDSVQTVLKPSGQF